MMMSHQSCTLVVFAILAGPACGAQRHDPVPAAPAPRTEDSLQHRRELVARAEQALTRRWPLDYRRPFNDDPYDEDELASRYLAACRAGDKPSCWIGAAIEHWDLGRPASAQVLANCRAGHLMSCRAIPEDVAAPDLPGASGRSLQCTARIEESHCDIAALRRECRTKFALSCWRLATSTVRPESGDAQLFDRVSSLVKEDCGVGIAHECFQLYSDEDDYFGPEHRCPIDILGCSDLAEKYRKRGDLERARDLMERACQYSADASSCIELGDAYLTGALVEPVPGRGEALVAWGCSYTLERKFNPVCHAREASRAKPP
ncbi:MAG TPA: hypothetical protein VFT22_40595 [Kofleriaceae bacterium]|nr:hypothetical protein [Kofleriaceae bacterium]